MNNFREAAQLAHATNCIKIEEFPAEESSNSSAAGLPCTLCKHLFENAQQLKIHSYECIRTANRNALNKLLKPPIIQKVPKLEDKTSVIAAQAQELKIEQMTISEFDPVVIQNDVKKRKLTQKSKESDSAQERRASLRCFEKEQANHAEKEEEHAIDQKKLKVAKGKAKRNTTMPETSAQAAKIKTTTRNNNMPKTKQRKRTLKTEEQKQKDREYNRERRKSIRRATMTEEEREKARQHDIKKRVRMTDEQKARRNERQRIRLVERKKAMTPEEKKAYNRRYNQYKLSEEAAARRKERTRLWHIKKRETMTEEERAQRNEARRQRRKSRVLTEEQQKAKRNEADRQRQKSRVLTEEQKAKRNEAIRQRRKSQVLTDEEKAKRRENERKRWRNTSEEAKARKREYKRKWDKNRQEKRRAITEQDKTEQMAVRRESLDRKARARSRKLQLVEGDSDGVSSNGEEYVDL